MFLVWVQYYFLCVWFVSFIGHFVFIFYVYIFFIYIVLECVLQRLVFTVMWRRPPVFSISSVYIYIFLCYVCSLWLLLCIWLVSTVYLHNCISVYCICFRYFTASFFFFFHSLVWFFFFFSLVALLTILLYMTDVKLLMEKEVLIARLYFNISPEHLSLGGICSGLREAEYKYQAVLLPASRMCLASLTEMENNKYTNQRIRKW